MTDDPEKGYPSHYCSSCTAVRWEHEEVCLDCNAERPDPGWDSVEDGYDSWLGRVLDGRYFITKRLGRGSVGAVYRAQSIAISRTFAIKIINIKQTPSGLDAEQIRGRLKREVSAIGKMRNPHIVPFYEVVELFDAFLGVVMDYVEGQTLESLVLKEFPLSPERTCKIIRQIANGLHEAHEAGMIHRDLKPENIMVEKLPAGDDFVHVLDFGIVQVDDGVDLTRGFLGTPLFASPEQAMAGEIDRRSDIYSLGAVCYFLLTRQPPFVSENVYEILRAHVGAPVVPPSEVTDQRIPEGLEDIVLRMLSKPQTDRPQSLAEVIKEIDTLLVNGFQRTDSKSVEPINSQTRETGPQVQPSPATLEEKSLGAESSEEEFQDKPAPIVFATERDKTGPKAVIFRRNNPTRRTVAAMIEKDRDKKNMSVFDRVVQSETGVFQIGLRPKNGLIGTATTADGLTAVADGSGRVLVRKSNEATDAIWYNGPVEICSIAAYENNVVIGSSDGRIIALDESESEETFSDVRGDAITAVGVNANGSVQFAGSESGRVYRRRDGSAWSRIQDGPPVNAVGVSADGVIFAVARKHKEIALYRVDQPKIVIGRFQERHRVRDIAFSNDGHLLALVLADDSVSIYQVLGDDKIMSIKEEVGSLRSVSFNSENALVGFFEREGVLFGLDLQRVFSKA